MIETDITLLCRGSVYPYRSMHCYVAGATLTGG
jgi:hypothetical protein